MNEQDQRARSCPNEHAVGSSLAGSKSLATLLKTFDANPMVSRRVFLGAAVALPACATLGIEPTREELAFYERLKSIPRGKVVPITEFPEIMAGVGNKLPEVDVEPEKHKPPIGIDYFVNVRFPFTPIVAPAAGLVLKAESNNPQAGAYATLRHGWHYTLHGHMHPMLLLVKEGQFVDRGTLMGFGYNSGTNAKGIFHYHLGTYAPTFDPVGQPHESTFKFVNPRGYGSGDMEWGGLGFKLFKRHWRG